MSVRKECILIVDDEVEILEMLQEDLQASNRKCLIAQSAEEALKLYLSPKAIKEEPIDFLLSDLSMGGLSGLELQLGLNYLHSHLSFAFLTGFANRFRILIAMKNGAFDFLEKPCNFDSLREVVNQGVARSVWLRSFDSELKSFLKDFGFAQTQMESLLRRGMHSQEVGSDVDLSSLKSSIHHLDGDSVAKFAHIEESFRKSYLLRSRAMMASLLDGHDKLSDQGTVLAELRSIHFKLRSMHRASFAFGFEGLGSLQECLVDIVVGLRTFPGFHGSESFDLLRTTCQVMQKCIESIGRGDLDCDELMADERQKALLLRDRIVERLYGSH